MKIVIHNHWIDKLAVVTGVFAGLALYPQVYVLISSGATEQVSITTYLIIFINSVVWLVYSVHRALLSLAIPSILNIFAAGVILVWFFAI